MLAHEKHVKERIGTDLASHAITVLHADGLYRHYRCAKPTPATCISTSSLGPARSASRATWVNFCSKEPPTWLPSCDHPAMSYSYAAEKCVAPHDPLEEWNEEVYKQVLADRLKDSDDGTFTVYTSRGKETRDVREAIAEIENEYENYSDHHDATKAMYESGLVDGADLPSCETYTYRFLWCLHAISWFCKKVGQPCAS